MDLRIQRTLRNIERAFITLRSRKPIEKISVKELASLAEINKATFYLHYKDIFDLSESIENKLIGDIFADIRHPDAVITEPRQFTSELAKACVAHSELINIVFSGGRKSIMVDRMGERVKKLVFDKHPEYKDSIVADILITYSIKGG